MLSIRNSSLELIKQLSDYCGLGVEEVISAYEDVVKRNNIAGLEDLLDYSMYLCLHYQNEIKKDDDLYDIHLTKDIHKLPYYPRWIHTGGVFKEMNTYLRGNFWDGSITYSPTSH